MFKNKPLAALVALACSQAALAANTATLDEVVVTATRTATPVAKVLSDITVLGREEIAQSGSLTITELLSREAGVEFYSNGGEGKSSSLMLRGATAKQTVVLIDGMRVVSATAGTTSLENLNLDAIERIEILRGPASAVYGSDAIGGVIQVFTKAGREAPALTVQAGAGNRGAYETSLAHAHRAGGLSYGLKLGTSGFDGINAITSPAYPGYNPDRDGYRNRNANLHAAYEFNRNLEVRGGYFQSSTENRYDAFQSLPPPLWSSVNGHLDYRMKREVSGANVYAKLSPKEAWNATLRLAQGIDRAESPAAVVGDPASLFKTTQDQFSWQNDIRLPVGQAMILLERIEQSVVSSSSYSRRSRTIDSLAAGWHGNLGRHSLQANWRSDENSQFGRHDTYLLGYGYRLADGWRLAASQGTAFKAPTMNDLYFPITPGVGGGNAALRPEESKNREVSLRYQQGRTRASLSYFDNRIRNLISWTTDPVTFYSSPDNVGRARIEGWELTAGTALGAWELAANLTVQDARDEETGERLRRRARQFGTLSATYAAGALRVGGELKGVGQRYDDPHWQTRRNQVSMAGYGLVNLFADYRLSRAWQVFARVDNLLDRKYEMARSTTIAYGVPGIMAFAGLRYTFE